MSEGRQQLFYSEGRSVAVRAIFNDNPVPVHGDDVFAAVKVEKNETVPAFQTPGRRV